MEKIVSIFVCRLNDLQRFNSCSSDEGRQCDWFESWLFSSGMSVPRYPVASFWFSEKQWTNVNKIIRKADRCVRVWTERLCNNVLYWNMATMRHHLRLSLPVSHTALLLLCKNHTRVYMLFRKCQCNFYIISLTLKAFKDYLKIGKLVSTLYRIFFLAFSK